MHFDTLAEHRAKYAAVFSVLVQELENRSKDCKTSDQFMSARPLSVDINTLPANFQMQCIELQLNIQFILHTRGKSNSTIKQNINLPDKKPLNISLR